jgi:hypothetical protein
MVINNGRKFFVAFLASVATGLMISPLCIPLSSFADRIYVIRAGTTISIGCDLSNDDDFIPTTKIFNYDLPSKLTFNCERSGADIDLKKGESIAVRCLHDNPLTIARDFKMKAGELFYILCKD